MIIEGTIPILIMLIEISSSRMVIERETMIILGVEIVMIKMIIFIRGIIIAKETTIRITTIEVVIRTIEAPQRKNIKTKEST